SQASSREISHRMVHFDGSASTRLGPVVPARLAEGLFRSGRRSLRTAGASLMTLAAKPGHSEHPLTAMNSELKSTASAAAASELPGRDVLGFGPIHLGPMPKQ